jgi:hypothetical protein
MAKSRKLLKYSLLISTLFVVSCSPKISSSIVKKYSPLVSTENVLVIEQNDSVPASSENLGTVRVGDAGLTVSCDYLNVLEAAKLEARKVGGNAIKIVVHQYPDFASSCHRITADILKVSNLNDSVLEKASHSYANVWKNQPFSHWRLAVNAGLTYNMGRIDESMDSHLQTYYKELKTGTQLGADVTYFFNQSSGIGFSYYILSSGNSLDGVTLSDANGSVFAQGVMRDDIQLSFIGPMYSGRLVTGKNKNNAVFANVGLGYVGYTDKTSLSTYYSNITGSTLGILYSIGYDHALSKTTSLGVQLSYVAASLWQYDQFDGTTKTHVQLDKDNFMTLGHVEISVGLRFNSDKK